VTADISTDPDRTGGPWDEVLVAPGRMIELNTVTSHGTCVDGMLQFRFSIDGGPELRGWSDNPIVLVAPRVDTDYRVEVRCSTDLTCMDSRVVDVDVGCPASGNLNLPFAETILAGANKLDFAWTTPLDFDLFSGDLDAVSSYAGDLSSGSGSSFPVTAVPPIREGYYYVVRRSGEYCNEVGLWTSSGPAESPLRESSLP
jgi:hypothetical protein